MDIRLPKQKMLPLRLGAAPAFMHYNRLIVLILLFNGVVLALNLVESHAWLKNEAGLALMSNMVLINFFIAIVIRQQYTINFLFWLATRAPLSWPLFLRRRLGKVYHFGGLHVGCALAASLWFLAYIVVLSLGYPTSLGLSADRVNLDAYTLFVIDYSLALTLLMIIGFALPFVRARFHDNFEIMHRLGGWSALLLFWLHTLMLIKVQSQSKPFIVELVQTYEFWLLVMITLSIALPWLRLKKVPITIERPSTHVAIARFDYGVTPFAGSSTAISLSPLYEWHSFANVPTPKETGFRLTISRAGDWTGNFIDHLPSHVWVKGIPTAGVANIEVLFKRVVYIATGSGIGPCLPHLLARDVPSLLVWSTRNARETYGDDLVDEILAVQPDAIIWDTNEQGKPDMLKLAYSAYKAFDAEAVICISNKKLTWQVVSGMESRGIPAYGAIWDS